MSEKVGADAGYECGKKSAQSHYENLKYRESGMRFWGVAQLVTVVVLVILCAGTPDLIDALVSHVMRTCP